MQRVGLSLRVFQELDLAAPLSLSVGDEWLVRRDHLLISTFSIES